ncbi:MAG TPA: hypothetical protein VM580_29585, partial [Labilithrix sp.]|nr:hypothetical protein [Labilithrix sp.]
SGSGVVPSFGGAANASGVQLPPGVPSAAKPTAAEKTSNALLIVITVGCFVLAGLLIVVLGLRVPRPDALGPRGNDSPSATVSVTPEGSTVAVSEPSVPATGAPTSSSTSVASATPSATTTTVVTSSPPSRIPHTVRTASTKATASTPAAVEEPGFVTVSAYPWAKVTEGGKVICAVTPCSKVAMSPGAHTLIFENGEAPGQKQTIVVQVKSGETAAKNVGFK